MYRAYAQAAVLAVVGLLSCFTNAVRAQTPFSSLTGFGDSYADTGSAPGGTFKLFGPTCPPIYPTCRFSDGTNFVDSLQALYGLPGHTNYAFGGALTSGSLPPFPIPDFLTQVATFAAAGSRFGSSDLVAISIGGNDQGKMTLGMSEAQIKTLATDSAKNAIDGVNQLFDLGARNVAWVSPGNPKYFPGPFPPPPNAPLTENELNPWAATYFLKLQEGLAPLAAQGLRVFLFDYETLQKRIKENTDKDGTQRDYRTFYGFDAVDGAKACLAVTGGAGCSKYFYYDNIHPTSAGFELIAHYMQNQIDAPLTVAPQGDVIQATASSFANSVLGQLDAYRTFGAFGMGSAAFAPPMYVGKPAPQDRGGSVSDGTKGAPSRWAVWAQANLASGSGDGQFYSNSFEYDASGATAGIEYRATSFVRYGMAVSVADADVDLAQKARYDVSSFQAAWYASAAYPNWFADTLLAYGRHGFETSRPGIIDTIRGETHGDTFIAAIKGGYLINAGPVRIGPIAGLTYTWSHIDAYTETGDILLTMKVDDQKLDTLTGSAGVQVRLPFAAGNSLYSPFINVTLEHDFFGSGRMITTTQVTTPLLPVLTPIEDRDRTYGKVAGGLAVNVAGNTDLMLNAFSTFGRSDRNDFGVNAGIRVGF